MGLFFLAQGIALTRHGNLGISPISSVPNVMSLHFEEISMGTWMIIWNFVFILGQIMILRRNFKPIQFLQIPLSILFGWFADFGLFVLEYVPVNSYPVQLAFVLVGIGVSGFGVSLAATAGALLNSPEAFMKAVSDTFKKEFGNIKIGVDISCVLLGIVLSLLFFNFTLVGVREGTILSALLTGHVVKFFTRRLKESVNRYCAKK